MLIISGSSRRQYNCPEVDSRARTLMLRMAEALPPEWGIDYEDIGNVYKREQIRSCNACVSTSMALCVWPCNYYEPGSSTEPDLMSNLDMYSRLDLADAWAIVGPVNWYAPTSSLSVKHLEGGSAGFFCYGDGGEDEMAGSNRPKILRHPEYFDGDKEPFAEDLIGEPRS
ncbi:MAG: hypothetical protein ABJC26_18440 [Gemmatimonadaceae bacterium]